MSDPSPLEFVLTETERDGHTIVALSGDLDIVAADEVVAVLRRRLDADGPVTIDLTEVLFMDSSGLAAIVRAPVSDEERRRITVRASRHPQPRRLMTLTGVMEFFNAGRDSSASTG